MEMLARLTLIAGAVALLSGCGAPQSANPSVATTLQASSPSRGDFVYFAGAFGTQVYIYSFPGGKRVGTLNGFKNTAGLCSDSSGNVWVIDAVSRRRSAIFEYAHGGYKRIASLRVDKGADACAVDPSSGDLAVATSDASVAVWTNGQGSPTLFSTAKFFKRAQTIAYDGLGNLYVRSFVGGEPAAWLPKGDSALQEFSIAQLGSYGWDGQYFVVGPKDGGTGPLTRYKLSDGSGAVVGKVSVKLCAPGYAPPRFAILGSKLALSCGLDETNSLNYYHYPKGGKPIVSFVPGESGSVAISAE
jgi:WD40 repeat protein